MSRPVRPRYEWEALPFSALLEVRFCDLGVRLEGTWLEGCVERLYEELDEKGIVLRPHCWLAEEWFSPADVPGIAVPFYLAHTRLMALERRQMFEVEGGSRAECMKLLRHETGHCVEVAYRLHRRRRWQRLFGRSSKPYPDYYQANPASRHYVQHLDAWYAQSHPDEDFAETFAVWLRPRSDWRRRYAGWPALKKLELVDELMADIRGARPIVRSRSMPGRLSKLRRTLREHYEAKCERYSVGYPRTFDRDLRRLFKTPDESRTGEPAAAFLRRNRKEIREAVARWTGEYPFTVDQVLKDVIQRSREMRLRAVGAKSRLRTECAIMLTAHTVHTLRRREWHPL